MCMSTSNETTRTSLGQQQSFKATMSGSPKVITAHDTHRRKHHNDG